MLNPFAERVRRALLGAIPALAGDLSETPGGDLLLVVPHPRIPSGLRLTTEGGELTVGFRSWHTHGDLLGGSSEEAQIAAVVTLVGAILSDRVTVVISEASGRFEDAWLSDDPAKEPAYQAPGETLRIGTWSELAK